MPIIIMTANTTQMLRRLKETGKYGKGKCLGGDLDNNSFKPIQTNKLYLVLIDKSIDNQTFLTRAQLSWKTD